MAQATKTDEPLPPLSQGCPGGLPWDSIGTNAPQLCRVAVQGHRLQRSQAAPEDLRAERLGQGLAEVTAIDKGDRFWVLRRVLAVLGSEHPRAPLL